jgi:hypothetical protein
MDYNIEENQMVIMKTSKNGLVGSSKTGQLD